MLVLGLLFQVTRIRQTWRSRLLAGASPAGLPARPTWTRIQNWCASDLLIGLGFRLALERR
jgi:hypothetical protein